MLDAGRHQRSGAAVTAQVRRWAEAQLGPDETPAVLVTELACHEPGCPPIETVIVLIGGKGSRTWKIPRPAAELSAADVSDVLSRPPAAAAEPHSHRDGCCGAPPKPPAGSTASLS